MFFVKEERVIVKEAKNVKSECFCRLKNGLKVRENWRYEINFSDGGKRECY